MEAPFALRVAWSFRRETALDTMRQNTPFASVSMRLDALTLTPDAPPSRPLSPALTPLTPCCVAGNVVPPLTSSDLFGLLHVCFLSANNAGHLDQLRLLDGSGSLLERPGEDTGVSCRVVVAEGMK